MSFFCYHKHGEDMTIYLDLVFFLNLFFDFLLLLTVNNTLKRNIPIKKVILGAFVGSLSIFTIFIPFNTVTLFLFKILLSLFMSLITFGLKDKTYMIQNLSYLYMTSTVLGGFLYFLNLTFSESQEGLIFTYNEISVNYLFLVIISPIMLYIYYKQRREAREYIHNYQVTIALLNGKKIKLNSILDTGNKLIDPITKKKVILVNLKKLKNVNLSTPIYVPYNSLNHHGIIKCIKIDFLEIEGKQLKNYLVGISEGELLKDGVDCVLNSYCLEELK